MIVADPHQKTLQVGLKKKRRKRSMENLPYPSFDFQDFERKYEQKEQDGASMKGSKNSKTEDFSWGQKIRQVAFYMKTLPKLMKKLRARDPDFLRSLET